MQQGEGSGADAEKKKRSEAAKSNKSGARPEVARYKPGAFKQQEPEELLPGLRERFDQRAHGGGGGEYHGHHGESSRHFHSGGYRGGGRGTGPRRGRGGAYNRADSRNEGGAGHNKKIATDDKTKQQRDKQSKSKDERSGPPVSKEDKHNHESHSKVKNVENKVTEQKDAINQEEEKKKRPERVHYVAKKHDVTDTTNKEAEPINDHQDTGTKTRKKKKNKAKVKENKNNASAVDNQTIDDVPRPSVSKNNKKESGKHEAPKSYQERGEKKKDENNANKTKRNDIENTLREPSKKMRDSVDDISFQKPANVENRYDSTRSLYSREAAGGTKFGNRKSTDQENWHQSSKKKHEEYSTKSLPWRRSDGDRGGSARSGRGGGGGPRRNSPNSRGWWRDSSSRQSSPRRWSRPGSRTSSPRSSRGNSPHRYKQNSRRSSFDHRPGNQNNQIYTNKNYEHKSSRTKNSRTPSPKYKGSHRDTRDEVEFNIKQSKHQPKDSRDLSGWTRNDTRRRPESLSFADNKPPSGRIKSAPVNSFNVNDESKTSKKEEPVRSNRKESESLYSDWSQEIEEEEERSLSMEPPTVLPKTGETLCGRGVLRLVPEDSVPVPAPAPSSITTTPISSTTLTTNSWAYTDNTRIMFPPPNMNSPVLQHLPSDQYTRYLFDPNNPSKLIMMDGEIPRRDKPGFAYQNPPGIQTPPGAPPGPGIGHRFPGNFSRFSSGPGSMTPVISAPVVGFNQSYQRNQPGIQIQGPDWYDVFNQNIYGTGNMDINVIVRIIHADNKLKQIMQLGPDVVSSKWEFEVREARHEIMNAGWHLLKNEIYFVCNNDVDSHIWKTVYHQQIEMLRDAYLNPDNSNSDIKDNLKTCLLNLFEEGMDYYNQMLKDVSETYHVNLERFYDVLEPRDLRKVGKLALIVAQKVLLYLGDLSRYKEQINGTTNYGRARQYYLKANHLDMRNGRPFNMLAILAKMSNRKLEAVYYNIRCLTSTNAIPASKEGLAVLFHEMKRRWEANEKQKLDKKAEEEKSLEDSCLIKGSRVRREIWIRNEDGPRLHRTTSANPSSESSSHDFDTLSIADLNKRFINTFLHIQGMFFTQINTEDLVLASDNLLNQFRTLVNKSPLPISTERLVEIMALNMYSIEKTRIRSNSSAYRSVMQSRALELAGDMFGVLLERCNLLVAAISAEDLLESRTQRHEDLTPLLAAVKVWCDWLMGNNDSWCPVVTAAPFTQLAQLATRLEPVKQSVTHILTQCLSDEAWTALPQSRRADYEIIRLTEDAILCEYDFWFRGLDWSTYRQFCPKSADLQAAEFAKRVDQIRMCVEFLEGLDPPVLKWSAPDNSHVCLVTDRDQDTQASVARDMAEAKLTALIARDEDILEESYSQEEDDDVELDQVTDEMARLRLRKVELEKLQSKEAKRAQRQILDEHVRTTLEIRPKFILPDTNEFIDNLPAIKHLASLGSLHLMVCVVVVGELEGLSKSKEMVDRPEHAAMLRDNSKAALAWIRERPLNVKVVTTKGNIVNSVKVTVEEDGDGDMTNDDKILSCCLALDTSPVSTTTDGMKTVYRNSVLLTDDRNLKLKAHIEDCAVSRINHFTRWYINKH